MSPHFKHEETFSGILVGVLKEYLKTYVEACVCYKASEAQLLKDLHKLFGGEPKRFYRENFIPTYNNYAHGKAFLIRNYSSFSTQNRTRRYLQGIALKGAIAKES